MMLYLLDTNTVSEAKKKLANPGMEQWMTANQSVCHVSAVTIGELLFGVERMADGKNKNSRRQDFDFLLEDFKGRFYDFDGFAAAEWGRYAAELERHYGADWYKTFDQRDTMIAAIAREYGLTIVTRNEKHFPFCETVNPFSA